MTKHHLVWKDVRDNVSRLREPPAAMHLPVEIFNPILVPNTRTSEAPTLDPLPDISAYLDNVVYVNIA